MTNRPISLKEAVENWLKENNHKITEIDHDAMLISETTLSEIIEKQQPITESDAQLLEHITKIEHEHWLKIDKHQWNYLKNRQP